MDVSEPSETRKRMGRAFKARMGGLAVPGQVSAKVSTSLRLEATLKSGCTVTLACASVTGGHPVGHYGLYWLLSLSNGPVLAAMTAIGLHARQGWHGPVFFRGTSHNLADHPHHEVGPHTDADATAAAIYEAFTTVAFPLIKAFEFDHDAAVDFILDRGKGHVRNPFTASAILLTMAGRLDRLDELVARTTDVVGFYDARTAADARTSIVGPVTDWLQGQRRNDWAGTAQGTAFGDAP